MQKRIVHACLPLLTIALLTGCNSTAKEIEKSDYKAALNQYYQGWPRCIWPESVAAPIETADPAGKAQLEALSALGLMRPIDATHKSSAKATYDLTEQGKAVWTPDVLSPGSGNFCYGRPRIVSVDKSKRANPSTDLVDYHYTIADAPAWTSNPVAQTAFPDLKADLSGPHMAQALLLDTTAGYRVHGAPRTITAQELPVKRHLIRKMLHNIRARV